MDKFKIYLDDIRTPIDSSWLVVRDYESFVKKVLEIEFYNIEIISFDHDLGDSAMEEYWRNVTTYNTIDYNNIKEKTGLDCAKWLVNYHMDKNLTGFPEINVHSYNPVGTKNIMSYINNFLKVSNIKVDVTRLFIPFYE